MHAVPRQSKVAMSIIIATPTIADSKKGWGQLAKAEEGTSPEPASAEGKDRGRGSVDVIF
jgi:hypothetical protein